MDRILVHVASERAIAAALARARAHNAPGGMLEDLAMIVRGERTARNPDCPLRGLGRRVATPKDPTTYTTGWVLPILLTVQVVTNDTDEGFGLAAELAGRAMHAMFTDPVLVAGGMDPLSPEAMTQDLGVEEVASITPGPLEPPVGSSQQADLFQARATVNALLRTTL